MKRALALALCAAFLIVSGGIAAREGTREKAPNENGSKPLASASIYLLNSAWTDQDGKSMPLVRFRGKPLVLAMIYTNCKDICPMIVADMQAIQNALPAAAREQVGFALFSFDPEQDRPSVLKQYASAHGLNAKHWTLLTSSAESVRMLAAVLGIRYKKEPSGEFAHSSLITVLDSGGEIWQQQAGVRKDPGQIADVLTDLLSHAQ